MGFLKSIDISNTGCTVYVETGTGRGISLSKASNYFDRCFSVDMDPEMVNSAKLNFPNALIEIGTSVEILERWLKLNQIDPSESVLFYLDAHFPGADFHGEAYDVEAPDAVPLQAELNLIKKYRPNSKDLIICDDARIYLQGPFENGNVEWLQVPGGLNFLQTIFPMKNVSVNFGEEGYIIIDLR